jgi:hypothetical protein
MLTILGGPNGRQDPDWARMSRRCFLKVGGMAAGGLSLSQLLSIDAHAKTGSSHKALINIYLPGGPSHHDSFDLKPDSPSEVRGEFRPISTNVPGIQICEMFPRMAKMMDKFALIRSIVGSEGLHDGFQCMTGRLRKESKPPGGWPSMAAVVSRLEGEARTGMPPNLSLMYPTGNRTWGEPGGPGFVGAAHAPMPLVNKDPLEKPEGMTLKGISLERLRDRQSLLKSVDTFRRDSDASGSMDGLDRYGQQAMDILSTSKLAEALDLSKEDPRIVERYGPNDLTYQRDGAPRMIQNFLVARRLVEAGARVVSLNYSRWDWHGEDGMNFPSSRIEFPMLDKGLTALVTDLHERGLDKDVSVVVWGEFGRTPRINQYGGRDHWPGAGTVLFSGGGLKMGRVVGATSSGGEYPTTRAYNPQNILSTLYHVLGIDPSATIPDLNGRPQYILDDRDPVLELI